MHTVPLVLCTHCSSGHPLSLFLWSSVPIVPVVLCAHCSFGLLYPLFHWSSVPPVLCSFGPLSPMFLWSSVPIVPLVLCTRCSSGPLYPLFLWSSGPLYPLFLWSSVPTVPLVLCTLCSSGLLYPLSFPFCYIYISNISYFKARYMKDFPKCIICVLMKFAAEAHFENINKMSTMMQSYVFLVFFLFPLLLLVH